MTVHLRIVSVFVTGILAAFSVGGCAELRKDVNDLSHPDGGPPSLTNEQKIKLIDSMRPKGSFEAAREHLTDTAQSIAEQIIAAAPGQSWKFAEDENERDAYENGSLCDKLDPDIGRRPRAKTVEFAAPFSANDFSVATDVVRRAAAKYGATTQTSLFNDSAKREYDVQGSGYEFNLGQMKLATLLIKGDCFLLQKIIDLPPGQLPS